MTVARSTWYQAAAWTAFHCKLTFRLLPVTVVAENPVGALRLTVTVADPDAVPAQFASLMPVIVYVVLLLGLTVLLTGLTEISLCVKPSDQVTLHGEEPVRAA